MVGVYQYSGKAHLHRDLAQFDFRYNRRVKFGWTDAQRIDAIMAGIKDKHLTYRWIGEAGHAETKVAQAPQKKGAQKGGPQ